MEALELILIFTSFAACVGMIFLLLEKAFIPEDKNKKHKTNQNEKESL